MQLRFKQKLGIIMFLLVAIVLVLIKGYINERNKIYVLSSYENEQINNNDDVLTNNLTSSYEYIKIHIEGAVEKPGLYELPADSRVNDAIIIAGGLLNNADRRRINLAKRIIDEDYIYIPAIGEEDNFVEGTPTEVENALININIASKEELESLIGIGPALADRIINYREQNGHFNSIEELLNVNGIGEKRFKDISNSIVAK